MNFSNYFSKFKDGLKKAISSKPYTVKNPAYKPAKLKKKKDPIIQKQEYKIPKTPSSGLGVGH